jgi:hypothetical protein
VYLIEISQEDSLNIKRNWAGVISCFLLFTVVCMSLAFNVKGAFRASGHPELGLLFLPCRGGCQFSSRKGEVVKPPVGRNAGRAALFADDALLYISTRSFWQELAWLLSAVFWCAPWRALLLICAQSAHNRRHHK